MRNCLNINVFNIGFGNVVFLVLFLGFLLFFSLTVVLWAITSLLAIRGYRL